LSCPGSVDLGVLLPQLAGVIVEEVAVTAGLLLVTARARQGEAACPKCGTASARVHSRYSRRLADAAVGGRQVEIRLAVRRFLCRVPGCERRIKMVKRQMFGRAGLPLLRKRVLLTAKN